MTPSDSVRLNNYTMLQDLLVTALSLGLLLLVQWVSETSLRLYNLYVSTYDIHGKGFTDYSSECLCQTIY